VCREERGPAYLIVPTTPAINAAFVEVYHDGTSNTASAFGYTVLTILGGDVEVVEPITGIGSLIEIERTTNFLKDQPFYFVATGTMDSMRLPEISCPDGT